MRKNRKLSIGVLLVFIMTVFGGFSLYAADLGDISEHWAQNDVQAMVDKGVVTGYPDNTFKPDNTITRAEFITIVNKAFSFNDSTQISYKDVKTTDWFAPHIARAEKAGYIAGYEDNTMRPNNNISRQEAAVIISRVLSIDTEKDIAEADKFIDAKIIPSWSKGAVAAVVKAGYMKGYPDGTFKAGAAITRAEAVVTLGRVLGLEPVGKTVFNKAGEYGPATGIETIDDNVTITVSGVTLKNMTINGDLTIAATVGAGDFTLRNITVTGTTYVNGGGANSGLLDGFKGDILINKDGVRLIATGKTSVDTITLNTYANLKEDSKLTANGFNNAILADSISAKTTTTIAGGFNDITIDAADVTLQMVAGSVISNLEINKNSTVKGSGKITYASVNSAGVVIDPTPDKTVIAKGLTAIIGGKEVSGTYLKPSTPGGGGGGGSVVPPITEITSLDAAGTYDGDYRLVNLTQDTVLGPETDIAYITGTLYLDPGEVYDLKLRNITANKIVVESGKTESITLLNVGVLSVLIIDDDNGVRIVAQDGTSIIETRIDKENQGDSTVLEVEGNGSLGTIKVNAAGKLTLKGDFGNHPVNVAGDGADINLGATAKVANVNVSGKAKVNAEAGAAVAQISITGSTEVELGGDMSGTAVAITAANAKVGIKENAQIGTISVEASATIDTAAGAKIDQVQVTKANTSIDLTGTGSVETVSVTEEAQGSTVKVNAAVNQLKVAANVTLEGDKADTISEVVVEGEDVEISASEEVANALKTKAIAKAQAALNSLPADPSSLKLAADYQNVIDALGSVNAIKAFDSSFDISELANIARLDGAVTQIFTLAVADAEDKVEIGFAGTDTANAITQKVTLPATVGDYGVTVTWSFNPAGIILPSGTVNRPSDQDAEVTATATLKRGDQTGTKTFNLIVKCKEKVAKPTANPEPGPVTKGTKISLSTDTEGAIIYYTLNNANPTASSTRYITPIVIDADTTIKAIAVKAGMLDSDMATFNYIVVIPGKDATLKDLTVDGTTVTGFDPAILTYNVALPAGTTDIPVVAGVVNDDNATLEVTAATELPGTTTIKVTAADGVTAKIYKINFTVTGLGTDATLKDLTVNGTTVTGFKPDTLTYNVELSAGTTKVPTVVGQPNDENADVKVTLPSSLPGTATIKVTAADGVTEKTYKINFTVATTPGNKDQAAPTGLMGIAPTSGNTDGKITGVDDTMEWCKEGGNYKAVGSGKTEIAGLEAGTYLVRYKAKTGYNAGSPATVIVPVDAINAFVLEMQNVYDYLSDQNRTDIRTARDDIKNVEGSDWDAILNDLLTEKVKECFGDEDAAKAAIVDFATALGEIYYSADAGELEGTLRNFKNEFKDSFQKLFGDDISVDDFYRLLIATMSGDKLDEIIDEAIDEWDGEGFDEIVNTAMKKAINQAAQTAEFANFSGKLSAIGWSVETLIDLRAELVEKIACGAKAERALAKALLRSQGWLN